MNKKQKVVRLDKIYTRGGDDGRTSLANGQRVAKHSARPQAYGSVDELNSVLGVCRVHVSALEDKQFETMIARIQNDLFDLGADLATPPKEDTIGKNEVGKTSIRITAAHVSRLENEIDTMNAMLEPLDSFILPGGHLAAAYLHIARAQCRRAERDMTLLAEVESESEAESVSVPSMQFINRLSDHLFVMARLVNSTHGSDILWVPKLNI